PMIPNSFQSVVIAQVGIIFMQLYFTKELLGIYSVGYQVSYSIHLLFTTLSLSWSPYLYEQLSNTKSVNRINIARIFYLLGGILSLGVAFIMVFSGMIIKLIVTSRYFGAIEFIPWFSLGIFFHGLYIFLLPILMKNEKQNQVSLVSFINMIIMIGLNIILIRIFGYIGISYAFAVTYFLMFIPIAIMTQIVFPLPWLKALSFRS
ncbi:MAG: polysaccharide biosynthesis C-terminal domain-containing protein, partial [Bacteroidales bacterium]|nr:polysaccharide biosynthesis C-terminal domain-containing protein [Bacteroidales bacterium]